MSTVLSISNAYLCHVHMALFFRSFVLSNAIKMRTKHYRLPERKRVRPISQCVHLRVDEIKELLGFHVVYYGLYMQYTRYYCLLHTYLLI